MEEAEEVVPVIDDKDWILQNLAFWGNAGLGMAVTLTTSSGLVTGVITSGEKYIQHLKESILPAMPEGQNKQVVSEELNTWLESYAEPSDQPPSFIHLDKAKILTPAGWKPRNDVMWRGKISSVNGFILGTFFAPDQE